MREKKELSCSLGEVVGDSERNLREVGSTLPGLLLLVTDYCIVPFSIPQIIVQPLLLARIELIVGKKVMGLMILKMGEMLRRR